MFKSLLISLCFVSFAFGAKSQNLAPRISLADSTNATFPRDTTVLTCENFAPLVFNATGCPNAEVYWKYFDAEKRIRIDTLSPNLQVSVSTSLYISCIDDEQYSSGQTGISVEIEVQTSPGKPNLQLTNNSVVQCLTDGQLYINSGCNGSFNEAIWQDGSRSSQYKVTQDGVYTARCVGLCGVGSEADTLVVNLQDTFVNYKPNITATQTFICGSETATIYLDDPLFPNGVFFDRSLFTAAFKVSSSNARTDSVTVVSEPGDYFLAITSPTCGTVYSDTITISNGSNPPVISAASPFICGDGSATIFATGCGNGLVKWSNNATGDTIRVSQVGTYSATCEKSCGESQESNVIQIGSKSIPFPPTIFEDERTGGNSRVNLFSGGCSDGSQIRWNVGLISDSISAGIGTYFATCENDCGVSIPSNEITIVSLSIPTAPIIVSNTKTLCGDERAVLSASGCINGTLVWSTGATATTINVGAGTYTATCSNQSGTSNASNVLIIQTGNAPFQPIITVDKTIICDAETATMTASGCNWTIKWSTGATTRSIQVSEGGSYTAVCENECGTSEASNTVIIREVSSPLPPVVVADNATICGSEKAKISGNCLSGSLIWSTGATSANIEVNKGTYTAICSNQCGVSAKSEEVTISNGNGSSAVCLPITIKKVRKEKTPAIGLR